MNTENTETLRTATFENSENTIDRYTVTAKGTDNSSASYFGGLPVPQRNEIEVIANNIQVAIIRCNFDDKLTITYANDGLFRMIGYTREQFHELYSNSLCAIVHTDDSDKVRHIVSNKLLVGTVTNETLRLICKNANFIWTIARGMVVSTTDGLTEFHCVFTDITVQKKTEEALLINDRSYEIALGLSDVTTFGYDIKTKRILTSEIDNATFGMPGVFQNGVEDLIATGTIAPQSCPVIRDLYRKIDEGATSARAVIYATTLEGDERTIELQMISLFDSDGKPSQAVGIRRDITDTIQLEREKDYGSTMVSNKLLIYEANITLDKMISYNTQWADDFQIQDTSSFSGIIKFLVENIVASEHHALFEKKLSASALTTAFKKGQHVVTLEYRKKLRNNDYHWFKKTVNIIKDKLTGDIIIRSYIADIHDKKVRELIALDEQRLYENMRLKASFIYEFNFTQNIFVSGHKRWKELFDINQTDNYSEMMQELISKALHPDDRLGFSNNFLRDNILYSFAHGKKQLVYEYRMCGEEGEYIWVRCTVHLFEEPQSGDIKGYSYIEDINDEKKKELALIYRAEHDLLTGFYNKVTTERLITDFLNSDGRNKKHAFLIIDVDYFKSINDNFGHSFGDAVLSQIAGKINDLFRDIDILGRIGGDEFVVFMKNITKTDKTLNKCQEICNKITTSYTKLGVIYNVSASIGIAFYNQHGTRYEELYKNSDSALYIAKECGRNQFKVYSDNMYVASSSVKAINQNIYLEPTAFDTHITQYVFRILYESQDKKSAIHSVLELVGKHYSLSRAYIFESGRNMNSAEDTLEWCNDDIEPCMFCLQSMSHIGSYNYLDFFNSDGISFIADTSVASPPIKELLTELGVKSLLMFSIMKGNDFMGFIGYDECKVVRSLTKKDISDLQSISNILGVFVTEMRSIEDNDVSKNIALSIINGLDSYAYVCKPNTYEIMFANEKAIAIAPNSKIGNYCYSVIWNRSEPCEDCPMKLMIINNKQQYSLQLHNSNLGVWIKSTVSWIDWVDSEKMCLINCVDITEFKE